MQSMTPTRMKPITNAPRLGRVARWRRGGFTIGAAALGLSLAALAAAPANAATHLAAGKPATVEVEVKTVAKYGKILVDHRAIGHARQAALPPGRHWCSRKARRPPTWAWE